jgi:putative ABC transport system substrate-binding protein
VRLDVLGASTEDEIDATIAAAAQRGADGLLVAGDAYFNSRRAQLIALAARHRIPANYDRKEIAIDGGLMSYGMNNVDLYRQVGIYTGQILKGARAASGHAAAAPPISVMNSRRFTRSPRRRG